MSAQERLGLDLIVLSAVVIAANPAMSGIALHEWVGFALLLPAFVHLVSNWDWVVRSVQTLLGKLSATSRVNFVADMGLFVSLVAVTLSGVLVLPGVSASTGLPASGVWHAVHLVTSNLTIAFTLLHLVLHANWIAGVVARMGRKKRSSSVPVGLGRPATVMTSHLSPADYYSSATTRR